MAVVGTSAPALFEYERRYCGYLAGGADLSGTNQSERGGRGRHGGNRQPWKRSWSCLLGMGFGSNHAARDVPGHVRSSSSLILVSSEHHSGLANDDRHVRGVDVLRRWIWHHARVYS